MSKSNATGAGRKHRHHYFPVFHLSKFADPDNSEGVWVHDRLNRVQPNPSCLMPRSIAAEDDLYSMPSEGGQLSDEFENWLEMIDGQASAVFPKLLNNEALSRGERCIIAAYVMSRDLRTPKAQTFAMQAEQHAADAGWAALKRDIPGTRTTILAAGGPDFTEEELTFYLEGWEPEANNSAFTSFIARHLNPGADRLFRTSWLLVDALVGQEFITSDLGIVKFRAGWHDAVPHELGWIARAEGWVVPLSHYTALVMAPGGDLGRRIATTEFLSRVNGELARHCRRFVFARKPMPCVLRSWDLQRPQ